MGYSKVKNSSLVVKAGLGIMAVVGAFTAQNQVQAAVPGHGTESGQGTLNQASLKSMASTWLKIPHECKDRGFNASPERIEGNTQSAGAQSVYAQFRA